jgi:hypothetical protein
MSIICAIQKEAVMKRIVVTVIGSMFWLLLAGSVWAAESPVHLSHTLKTQVNGPDSVAYNFTLHVENRRDAPVRNLAFAYVPLLLPAMNEILLNVGDIEGHGQMDIPFNLVTPIFLSERLFLMQALYWDGRGLNEKSNLIEFPVESRSKGGVQ